jgi:hypothetical protein
MHWDLSKPGLPLFRKVVGDRVAEATKARAEIQSAPDDTARAVLEAKHRAIEGVVADVRVLGDAVISAFFAEDKPKAREKRRATIESWVAGTPVKWDELRAEAESLRVTKNPVRPFHWEIEFPEVFTAGRLGFDSIVGNPPFISSTSAWSSLGVSYRDFLRQIHAQTDERAVDICAHFYRRAYTKLTSGGSFGLVATNTIRQGDTRQAGLRYICMHGGRIYRAITRYEWPGAAAVIVCIIHIVIEQTRASYLNDRHVQGINSFLFATPEEFDPKHLSGNSNICFHGSTIYGEGFTFDDSTTTWLASPIEEMKELIERNPINAEIIFPYMGGEELNTDPTQRNRRYVISFENLSEKQSRSWPDLTDIVEKKVRPQRSKMGGYSVADRRNKLWWQFETYSISLHKALRGLNVCFALSRVSAHLSVVAQPTDRVFSDSLLVFAFAIMAPFSVIQSRVHETWARFFLVFT